MNDLESNFVREADRLRAGLEASPHQLAGVQRRGAQYRRRRQARAGLGVVGLVAVGVTVGLTSVRAPSPVESVTTTAPAPVTALPSITESPTSAPTATPQPTPIAATTVEPAPLVVPPQMAAVDLGVAAALITKPIFAATERGGSIVVETIDPTDGSVLSSASFPEAWQQIVVDIAPADEGGVYLAACCSPVSGTIALIAPGSGQVLDTAFDQGIRVDVRAGQLIRSDMSGGLAIRATNGSLLGSSPNAGAVAVAFDPASQVAYVLVDHPTLAQRGTVTDSTSRFLARVDLGSDATIDVAPILDLGGETSYCGVDVLGNWILLHVASETYSPAETLACTTSAVDVVEVGAGQIAGRVELGETALDIAVGAGGDVIFVSLDGDIMQLLADGSVARLAQGDFVVVSLP